METLPRSSSQRQPSSPSIDVAPAKTRKDQSRGHGEGSVFRRTRKLKSGDLVTYWVGEVMVGLTADGRRDIRRVTGGTQRDTREKLDQLRADLAPWTTRAEAHGFTVQEFLARWLDANQASLRPRTWSRYVEIAEIHVLPSLGGKKLRALSPADIQRLYSNLAASRPRPLSPSTIRKVHALLHRALGQAVKWGAVPRNAAAAVDPPRVPASSAEPPTLDEARKLLTGAWGAADPMAPLWTVAIYTGCRQGELLGLRWSDIDIDHSRLSVRRTLEAIQGGEPVFGEPKSTSSRRVVAIGPATIEALRRQKARQREERLRAGRHYGAYDLVFATEAGTPLPPRNVVRLFKKALDRAGLPRSIRFHDLRHLSATLMLVQGIHPKVASGRLGHSTIGITQDLYTHLVEGLDADAAGRIEQALEGGDVVGGAR